jgi:hypothetical protein
MPRVGFPTHRGSWQSTGRCPGRPSGTPPLEPDRHLQLRKPARSSAGLPDRARSGPARRCVREPGQSLGPLGEPGSTSAGGGHDLAGRAHVRRHRCRRSGSRCICARPPRPSRWAATARGSSSSWRAWPWSVPRWSCSRRPAASRSPSRPRLLPAACRLRSSTQPRSAPSRAPIGRLAKTDRLDAELIARFAEQVRPSRGRCSTSRPGPWPSWSPGGARSSRSGMRAPGRAPGKAAKARGPRPAEDKTRAAQNAQAAPPSVPPPSRSARQGKPGVHPSARPAAAVFSSARRRIPTLTRKE